MIITLKKENELKSFIKKDKVLLDFFATWCGPCESLASHLIKLNEKHKDLTIVKINIDRFNEIAAKFVINAIPTLIYLEKGKIKRSQVGYLSYPQLERIIK